MKKIFFWLALLLTITFFSPQIVNVYASTVPPTTDTDDTEDESEGVFFDILFGNIKDFFELKMPSTKLPPQTDENGLAEASTVVFHTINNILLSNDYNFYFINPSQIADVLLRACGGFGIILFFIFWLVECGKSGIDFELIDGKGLVKLVSQLLLGLVVLSISSSILQLISSITHELTAEVLQVSNMDIVSLTGGGMANWSFYENDLPFLGFLFQYFNWVLGNLTLIGYNIVIMIFASIISISLVLRTIKLAIYQGVSPLFFACIGSKTTQRYFQNFLVQYISLALQLVFIAVIYSAFQISFVSYMRSMVWGSTFSFTAFGSGFVIMFCYSFMILKSGKLFDKILT